MEYTEPTEEQLALRQKTLTQMRIVHERMEIALLKIEEHTKNAIEAGVDYDKAFKEFAELLQSID